MGNGTRERRSKNSTVRRRAELVLATDREVVALGASAPGAGYKKGTVTRRAYVR